MNDAMRALILHSDDADHLISPTSKMLSDRGYSLMRATVVDNALALLETDRHDLLVVDLPNNAARQSVFQAVSRLDRPKRPAHIAVFADAPDMSELTTLAKASDLRVTAMLRPLHVHKLLGVLRKIERQHASV